MKKLFQRNILINLILILLLITGLIYGLFKSLNTLTKHGQEAQVTNVIGHKLPVAVKELAGFEFQIDSIYLPYKDPLEVLYQEPQAGATVKRGRTIFLTVNRATPPMVAMPNLVNISFRNAIFTLLSNKLIMGDTIFRPDIAAGSILEQRFNGRTISPGSNVPVGSQIDLVVGILPDSAVNVPNLVGKSFTEAKTILDGLLIQYSLVWEGGITDSGSAIVYSQTPESINELDFVNTINPGDIIDLRLLQNPSAELLQMNQPGIQKYFDPSDTSAVVGTGPSTNEAPLPVDANASTTNSNTQQTTTTPRRQKSRRRLLDELGAQESPNNTVPLPDLNDPGYSDPSKIPTPTIINEPAPTPNNNVVTPPPVVVPKKEEAPKVAPAVIIKKPEEKKPAPKVSVVDVKKPSTKTTEKPKAKPIEKPVEKSAAKPKPVVKPKVVDKPKKVEAPKPVKKDPVKQKNANDYKDEYN